MRRDCLSNSGWPTACSSWRIFRLRVDFGSPSALVLAVRLPVRTTETNASSSERSYIFSFHILKLTVPTYHFKNVMRTIIIKFTLTLQTIFCPEPQSHESTLADETPFHSRHDNPWRPGPRPGQRGVAQRGHGVWRSDHQRRTAAGCHPLRRRAGPCPGGRRLCGGRCDHSRRH